MNQTNNTTPYMPDGRPAPLVLTADEVILVLRLDNADPKRTLRFYRDEGLLTGIRIGRKVRYTLDEVMRFLADKVERHNGR